MKIKFTFWKVVFLAFMAAGFYGTVVRFTRGKVTYTVVGSVPSAAAEAAARAL